MRASALLRQASSRTSLQACRFVAGRRFRQQQHFHTSLALEREDDSTDTPSPPVVEVPLTGLETGIVPLHLEDGADGGPEKPPRPKDKSNYGSAARRAGRNIKRAKELPPVQIPTWFLDRNVVLQAHRNTDPKISTTVDASAQTEEAAAADEANVEEQEPVSRQTGEHIRESLREADAELRGAPYSLDTTNWREINAVARAGLQVPSWQRADVTASQRPHFVLFCPKDGASNFLDIFVRSMAMENGTDFLRLSPQDIAEIGGDYLDEPLGFRSNTMSTLGYDAPLLTAARNAPPPEDTADEEDFEEADEEQGNEHGGFGPIPFQPTGGTAFGGAIHIGTFGLRLQDILKSMPPAGGSSQAPKSMSIASSQQQPKDITPELKLGLLVETLLNTPEIKRVALSASQEVDASPSASGTATDHVDGVKEGGEEAPEPLPSSGSERGSSGLILLVHDYPQINNTHNGGKFLDKLHEVVDARRKEGQPILIVGTASSKNLMPSISNHAVKELQEYSNFGPMRTIVTPVNEGPSAPPLDQGHRVKIRQTNLRHIRDMLRRIASDHSIVAQFVTEWEVGIDSQIGFLSGLDESVWTMNRVQRVATTALGLLEDSKELTSKHLEAALELIESSDSAKVTWVRHEKEQRTKQLSSLPGTETQDDSKERIRKLRKKCNDHEKKLLNGVVHPEDIRTGFADVQAPPSTIDALKTLTSLSLVRPDAFKYGVLATDRIPGLLLYGPPGTGKTLLARAVAKESGATVLEVSGSDVYDMYVGEGEKNVRAIFSLAKKLTPCIVFIDEADAILGARSGGSNRTSHRELINQFLREWDGMTETSAFIMVATNRPFDLDEASLRRLPRRLLVDLPVEKDREAILKIHLKDELLDPDVSLPKLASETPFYSGSDLKNVAVAAALACVREEFETAAAHAKDSTDGTKYQYAEKRTLYPRHFTKAMEEISASISEDMGSLSAIRKFDEKYGDRRGRRKKGGYGFKTVTESEKLGSDAARVRNQS